MPDERFAAAFSEQAATPLLRVDFTDDAAWRLVVAGVTADDVESGYTPLISVHDDPTLDGADAAAVAAAYDRSNETGGQVLLADSTSMSEAAAGGEATVVCLDLSVTEEDEAEFGWVFARSFRCALDQVASLEANLSLANLDFADFADAADEAGGRFTGFDD